MLRSGSRPVSCALALVMVVLSGCSGDDEGPAPGDAAAGLACLDFADVFVATAKDSMTTPDGIKKLNAARRAAQTAAEADPAYQDLSTGFRDLLAALGDSEALREPLDRVRVGCNEVLGIATTTSKEPTVPAPEAAQTTSVSAVASLGAGEQLAREACDRFDRFNSELVKRTRGGESEDTARRAVMTPIRDAAARAAKVDGRWDRLQGAVSDYVYYALETDGSSAGEQAELDRIDGLLRTIRQECEKARV